MADGAGLLLELVRSGRARSRTELGTLTGLSRTAVGARIEALQAAGLLLDGDELPSSGGRPAGSLVLNAEAGLVLAVAVGRSRSQLALHDLSGGELASASLDHEVGAGPEEVMPRAVTTARALLGDAGRDAAAVWGIGLSLPGTVDPVRQVSVASPAMKRWDGVELRPYLTQVADAPLVIANDADVLASSELRGEPPHPQDLLVLKASTGIALGVIAGGRIVVGHRGAAGEIGHTTVPEAGDLPCRCGDVGCLETVASGWAITARLAARGRDVAHLRDVVTLAHAGDVEAATELRESGRAVGRVLAVAADVLNPEAVVVGGDMTGAFDHYAAGLRETLYARVSAIAARELAVRASTLGDRAGLVGCAGLALDLVLAPDAVDAALRRRRR